MKRLGHDGPSDRPDGIEDAEFVEIGEEPAYEPAYWPPPPPPKPTLGAWWKSKGTVFKALFLIIGFVIVAPVLAILFALASVEDDGTAGGSQTASEPQASDRGTPVTFPVGVRPEAVLAIDGGDADPTSTFRTMGAFFCPLIVDGWSIEAGVAASKRHRSGVTGSLITYSLTRVDDLPILMVAFRMDTGDGQPVEVLRKMRVDEKTTAGPQMWPLVHEILSQDLPQCRAYSGAVR